MTFSTSRSELRGHVDLADHLRLQRRASRTTSAASATWTAGAWKKRLATRFASFSSAADASAVAQDLGGRMARGCPRGA
jgi:hypothetical protein